MCLRPICKIKIRAYIAAMSTNTLSEIETRIAQVEASYNRQVALAGKNGYDHSLTELLKKDLEWLREKKALMEETMPVTEKKQ
jgi:hypothetical protein